MELNTYTSNPMLVGAIELLKADASPEHRNLFIAEMMKAKFMSPAMVSPQPQLDDEKKLAPQMDGERKLAPGSKVQLPTLTAPDGKHYFMAFTDKMELDKLKKPEGTSFVALSPEEYAGMLLRKNSPVSGFVINPGSANAVVPKELLASVLAAKLAKRKEADSEAAALKKSE